jgi:hypothetical protein
MALSAAAIEASAAFKEVRVDIKSLSDFADLLRKELETNLDPAWERLGGATLLEDKPQFGRSATVGLDYQSATYEGYLKEARLLLLNLIKGTRAIADAAEAIASQYQQSDQFASIQAEQVRQYLPTITGGAGQPTGGTQSGSTEDFEGTSI